MSDPDFPQIDIYPIGIIRTPFKEKFGIPRQSGLVESVKAKIIIQSPYDDPIMYDGLSEFSHIWLTFHFNDLPVNVWKKKVRPPRLGGNQKKGVFATRSPYRPNQLGLSVVSLLSIDTTKGVVLEVSGADLLDQTPILDIKPYLPYVDSLEHAKAGFANDAPEKKYLVEFSKQAEIDLIKIADAAEFKLLVTELLSLDPRPAFHNDDLREYHMRLEDWDVTWVIAEDKAHVLKISRFADTH